MKAVSPKQDYEYILKAERELPREEQTIFTLSHLSAAQEQFLSDKQGYQTDEGFVFTLGTSNIIALHLGLKKVVNFLNENGGEVEIERDEKKAYLPGKVRPIKLEFFDKLAKDDRDEVANVIKNGGELKDAELKN